MNWSGKFSADQKVSSYLAFILLLVLSFVVAWYTVDTGQKILDSAKNSDTFNPGEKINKELDKSRPNKK